MINDRMFNDLIKQSYLVVGTDTDVGKTYISRKLIQYFAQKDIATIGMKPIASGCQLDEFNNLMNEDVRILTEVSNISAPLSLVNPYRFIAAIAPHIAAEQANIKIEADVIVQAYLALAKQAEVVVVEGAGGFLVPINQTQTLADLAEMLDLPLILVVGMRLGCINHALLTVEAIKARGLTLAGWVANQMTPDMPMFEENLTTLRRHITAPCLGVCGFNE